MHPWKKFRIAFTIFTGLAILGIYTIKGTFSRIPINSLKSDLITFYTSEFNHSRITEVNEIHYNQNISHHTYFKVACAETYFPFIPTPASGRVEEVLKPGNVISKAAKDYHFTLTNDSGVSHLSMTNPADVRLPFDWEFPLIMGSFVIINLCIFFIFPKKYFESEMLDHT